MSETVTVSAGITGDIYGTFAGAEAYIGAAYGPTYTAWLALADGPQKQTLIAAARYIDRQVWADDYDTFAERDAFVLDDGTTYPFILASYELAVMIAADPTVIAKADQGSNIARVYAGGAGVDFFNPTSTRFGTAGKLPPILMDLIGEYLGSTSASTIVTGPGSAGGDENPLSDCVDYDRGEPY